jgi:hypothetical protein
MPSNGRNNSALSVSHILPFTSVETLSASERKTKMSTTNKIASTVVTPLQPKTDHNNRSVPTYGELMRSTGLPKSLSFRKICSRCGKTRAEHGELGFGHKCTLPDCGKCGAPAHRHELAKQPMGILCQLTVQDGAIPDTLASYEKKMKHLVQHAAIKKTKRSINLTKEDNIGQVDLSD